MFLDFHRFLLKYRANAIAIYLSIRPRAGALCRNRRSNFKWNYEIDRMSVIVSPRMAIHCSRGTIILAHISHFHSIIMSICVRKHTTPKSINKLDCSICIWRCCCCCRCRRFLRSAVNRCYRRIIIQLSVSCFCRIKWHALCLAPAVPGIWRNEY